MAFYMIKMQSEKFFTCFSFFFTFLSFFYELTADEELQMGERRLRENENFKF